MLKKTKCNNCNQEYDEAFSECPNCGAPNQGLDPNFKNITMLHFAKQIGLFLMGLLGFELLGIIVALIFNVASSGSKDEVYLNMLLNAIVYLILFVCLLLITNKDIIKLGKSFKDWKPYAAGFACFVFILLTGFIYSLILQKTGVIVTNNDNQQVIETTTGNYPLVSLIIFGFIGPICEELTYRVGLFSFLKRFSKWIAYPVTIIVFALIHFNFTASSLTNELINLPYYLLGAFALTFTYDKYGFAGSLTAHLLNNVISLIPFAVSLGVFH